VPWLPQVSYVVLILMASELTLGVFSAVFSPARNALMPNLVHPDQLLRANSMTNSAGTIASLIGFVVGGYLIGHSRHVALYVDAGTFLCSGILILCMVGKQLSHRPRSEAAAATGVAGKKRPSFLADIVEAIRYLAAHKRAVQIILLMFLFWCCGGIILSGLAGVVMGTPQHGGFGKSEAEFSYFLGYIGVGMILGAASCSIARRGIPKEFGVAWAMVLVGAFFFLFSVPQGYGLSLFFLICAAFFGAMMLVSLDTMLQRIVPDYIRGRVMALRDQLANVGLVGVALPLAISNGLDHYIILILRILSVVVTAVGLMLVAYYYKRQTLPLPVAIARRFVSLYLTIFKRFAVGNAGRIPASGPVIFVANHSTAYDPLCLQAASRYRLIQFMMAKEYYEKKPMNFFYRWLKVIPVNRTGNDTASIRTALRALGDGSCIGMFPEGKISDDGRMNEGRQGVALLALMSGATVVPAYIQGTSPYQGMVKDFLTLNKVTLYFGKPIRFDDLPKGKRDEASRDLATKRIMDAITALRDRFETNPERRISSAEYAARQGATPAPAPV